jgi:glucokinase
MVSILAADIGGTNSRFAAFAVDGDGCLTMESDVWLKTGEADSFTELLTSLEHRNLPLSFHHCDVAVFAVPGPVEAGRRAALPNVPWMINLDELRTRRPTTRMYLINDFVAQSYGCVTGIVKDAISILAGRKEPEGTVAVIGAGTGLGHCVIKPDGSGGFTAVPSEGGHAAFPFTRPEEQAYRDFLTRETGKPYAYGDLVVTGSGLSMVHRFLTGQVLSPEETAARIEPEDRTTHWFARFYARSCRNYALYVVPSGGLYISGGVAAHNRFLVDHPVFKEEFLLSPTHHELLSRIPVHLNTNEQIGLWGAAHVGLLSLKNNR